MEAMEEYLCEIKELVNHAHAASKSSEGCWEWNTTLNDSPSMLCLGKLIILIRLMADRFQEKFGRHSNQMVDISRTFTKCRRRIKRLYLTLPWGQLEMQLKKVVEPSFVLALSDIFSELEGVIKEQLAHTKAETHSDRTDKKRDFHKLHLDKAKLWKPSPPKELGRERELEQIDHKLMLLKEHTLTRKAILFQHAAEMKFQKQQDLLLELSSDLSEEKLKLQAALKENSRLVEMQQKSGQSSCEKKKAPLQAICNVSPKSCTATESRSSLINKPSVEESYPGTTFGQRRQKLLRWCQEKTKPYGLPMYEFSTSWQSGHALCAIIHSYRPELVDNKYLKCMNRQETLEYGVMVARSLGVRSHIDFVSLCLQKIPQNMKVFQFLTELYNCLEHNS